MLLTVTLLCFNSCKPDLEIYNPKCKISKIWYRSEVGDPDETYIYDKHDKLLEQIVMENGESFDFEYNKDKSISKIVHVGADYTEQIAFKSTKRLVDSMSYYVDGVVRMAMTVFHNEDTKRIDSIREVYDREFFEQFLKKSERRPLYNKFVGNYDEIYDIVSKSQCKDLQLHAIKRFTYDPGKHKDYKNISTYEEEYPSEKTKVVHSITYNVALYNPFYGMTFAYAGYDGYYVNAKISERVETLINGTVSKTEDIVYNYDGTHYLNDKNFPRQFITISSTNNVPVHTYILYKK